MYDDNYKSWLDRELNLTLPEDEGGKLTVMGVSLGPPELAETLGGALANFAKAGHRVVLVAMNLFMPDEVLIREYGLSFEEQLQMRMDDFKRLGDILGAEKCIHVGYHCSDWGKTLRACDYEPASKMMEIVRTEKPHILLCPDYYYDYNPGKIGTAEIVKRVAYLSGHEHEYKEISMKGIKPWCVRRMYFGDIEFGDVGDAHHTHYVDITDTLDTKIKAFQACTLEAISIGHMSLHIGQYTPKMGSPIDLKSACKIIGADFDYISSIKDDKERWYQYGLKLFDWELRRRAIRRGMECGVPYAEAYRMWHPANWYSPYKLLPWN